MFTGESISIQEIGAIIWNLSDRIHKGQILDFIKHTIEALCSYTQLIFNACIGDDTQIAFFCSAKDFRQFYDGFGQCIGVDEGKCKQR